MILKYVLWNIFGRLSHAQHCLNSCHPFQDYVHWLFLFAENVWTVTEFKKCRIKKIAINSNCCNY